MKFKSKKKKTKKLIKKNLKSPIPQLKKKKPSKPEFVICSCSDKAGSCSGEKKQAEKQTQTREPQQRDMEIFTTLSCKLPKRSPFWLEKRSFWQPESSVARTRIPRKMKYTSCGSTDVPRSEIQCLQVRAVFLLAHGKASVYTRNVTSLKDSVLVLSK